MSAKSVTPYLFFDGTADEAIALYERTLGARTEGLVRYGDHPATAVECTAGSEKRVMHALLHIGEARLMLSDSPAGKPSAVGRNVQLTLDFDDPDEMSRRFDALAASGTVTMAVQDTFWGARFGCLTDAHGVAWMFNCQTKPA